MIPLQTKLALARRTDSTFSVALEEDADEVLDRIRDLKTLAERDLPVRQVGGPHQPDAIARGFQLAMVHLAFTPRDPDYGELVAELPSRPLSDIVRVCATAAGLAWSILTSPTRDTVPGVEECNCVGLFDRVDLVPTVLDVAGVLLDYQGDWLGSGA